MIVVLAIGNVALSSCSKPMFKGRTYVQGNHATKQGAKAQAKASRQSKHYWF